MNAKNRKILFIFVAAALVAVMGGVGLYQYLLPQKTTIYVFRGGYKAGEVLTEDMLIPIQCDAHIVVAGKGEDTSSRFVTGKDIAAGR